MLNAISTGVGFAAPVRSLAAPEQRSTTDSFTASSPDNCSQSEQLRRLADVWKNQPPQDTLPADLQQVVLGAHGKDGMTSVTDERFDRLRGYFCQGLEYPNFNPTECLGGNWTELSREQTGEGYTVFQLDGPEVSQYASFNTAEQTAALITQHHISMIDSRHVTILVKPCGTTTLSEVNLS